MTYQQKPSAVTTGAIAGSHKVYSTPAGHAGIAVPFREVPLDRSAAEPPVRLYDTSGPIRTTPRRSTLRPGCRGCARPGWPARVRHAGRACAEARG